MTKKSRITFRFTRLCKIAWCCWAILVIVGSLLPGALLPSAPVGDKTEHFVAYFALTVLPPVFLATKKQVYWSPVGMILLGIGLEIGQLFVPGRTFDLFDIVANTVGASAGFVWGLLLDRALRKALFLPA